MKPSNYSLSLFDLEIGGQWSYNGIVKIDAEVKKASKEIVLNSKQLELNKALLKTNGPAGIVPQKQPNFEAHSS